MQTKSIFHNGHAYVLERSEVPGANWNLYRLRRGAAGRLYVGAGGNLDALIELIKAGRFEPKTRFGAKVSPRRPEPSV